MRSGPGWGPILTGKRRMPHTRIDIAGGRVQMSNWNGYAETDKFSGVNVPLAALRRALRVRR